MIIDWYCFLDNLPIWYKKVKCWNISDFPDILPMSIKPIENRSNQFLIYSGPNRGSSNTWEPLFPGSLWENLRLVRYEPPQIECLMIYWLKNNGFTKYFVSMSRLLGHAVPSNLISSCVRGATALGGYNFFTNISNPTKLRKKSTKRKDNSKKGCLNLFVDLFYN